MIIPVPASAGLAEYVKAQVSRSTVNAGDALVYTVEVMTAGDKPNSPEITPPDISGSFQVQDVFTRSSVSILNGKTHIITFKEMRLVANHTGRIVIPPSRVEFVRSGTGERTAQESNPVTVTVNEATGAAARPTPTVEIDVLRPIKRSAHLSPSQWLPFAIALVFMLTASAAVTVFKRRPLETPAAEPQPADPRTPQQRALEDLAGTLALKQAGKVKEFYTQLSVVLRRFLAEEYRFKAEELTTDELLQDMQRMEFTPAFLAKFRLYMQECDQVKFANVRPEPAALESAAGRARYLIEVPNKRPEPQPAPAPVSAPAEPPVPEAAGQEPRKS